MAANELGAVSVARSPAPSPVPAVRAVDGGGGRHCARPDCAELARATLVFSYGEQQAVLTALAEERRPQTYDLCAMHASRTTAPHGWQFRDDRPEDDRRPTSVAVVPDDLGSERTVAVLAAALRAVAPEAPELASTRDRTEVAAAIDEVIDAPEESFAPARSVRQDDDPASVGDESAGDDSGARGAVAGSGLVSGRASVAPSGRPEADDPGADDPGADDPGAAAVGPAAPGVTAADEPDRRPRPVLAARDRQDDPPPAPAVPMRQPVTDPDDGRADQW